MSIPRQGSINDSCWKLWHDDQRASGRRISLTLNGEEIPKPYAYDLDKGWVDAYAVNENGEPYTDGAGPSRVRYEGPIEAGMVPLK